MQPFPLGERLWHKNGVTSSVRPRRSPPPLDEATLQELALRYAGRYATTRAKLRAYLSRKLRERGWSGGRQPDLEALGDRFAKLGYVDDAAYALSQSRALTSRGYGKRRVGDKLRLAGVAEADAAAANALAENEAIGTALRFAERRRFGPFADAPPDRPQREKWIATMIRAGHPFGLARCIASMAPGADVDRDQLSQFARINDE